MLLSFRVANVLSFRDEQSLSFVATELHDGQALQAEVVEHGKTIEALPVVAIYGANASGKSNVLNALGLMRETVLDSLGWLSEPRPIRRISFALEEKASHKPSLYEVDIVLRGIRYIYGFEIDDLRVRAEWLHAYPKGRKQIWFERTEDNIDFPGEGLRGEKLDLRRRTRGDTLFLSVGALFNHVQLLPIFEWFRDNLQLIKPEMDMREREQITCRRVISDPDFRNLVSQVLRIADLGIVGFDKEALARGEVSLLHRAGNKRVPLNFERESLGTRSWFGLLGPLLEALESGSIILVDELDASLHPFISGEVVAMFQDLDVNSRQAQLLFTSHDVTLLYAPVGSERVLERDTVWLTEKQPDGATDLYPLASVSPPPRKDDNLFRKYLLGAYGGVPRISSGMVAREIEEQLA